MQTWFAGERRLSGAFSAIAALTMLLLGGCSIPWPGGVTANTATSASLAVTSQEADSSIELASTEATAQPEKIETVSEEAALAEVFADLQSIGEIDAAVRVRLAEDLRAADRELWPLIVTQFKSAVAYRKQVASKQSQSDGQQPSESQNSQSGETKTLTPVPTIISAEHLQTSATSGRANPEASSLSTAVIVSDNPEPQTLLPKQELAKILPQPPTTELSGLDSSTETAGRSLHSAAVQTASYVVPDTSQHGWQTDLQTTISQLEKNLSPTPRSTNEVHQHMRLRMLHLLADNQEEALAPIPGASPTQQDYWSKQLFALSSFLDNQRQPDDKQRAAGSLIHLDQARSKLAELATLQVRNISFVDQVEGFGIYERRESQEFRPGDPVTLYAEVENFRSDSTKTGYRTALATSYEVVDQNGQRVDGRQFPDVEDICQSQRQDFHMQYGVTLPTRIYPGKYELRLIITDQLSHKIGQAGVPFEIVE